MIEGLVRGLLEGDRETRENAAKLLRGQRFDLSLLEPVLAHPHVSRQIKAIEVLRTIRSHEAVALLVPMLASPVWLVGQKAASALGKIGAVAPDVIAAALDTVKSDDHRLHVLDALSRLGHPAGKEVLLVQTDAWNVEHRKLALDYLRRYREEPPVETILAALHDPDAREQAIDVAGRIRHPSFIEPLIAIWLDEEQPPKRTLDAISKYGETAFPLLLARAATAPRERIARAIEACLANSNARHQFWTLWGRIEPGVRDGCLAHLGTDYALEYAPVSRREALDEHKKDPDLRRRRACVQGYYQLARGGTPHAKYAKEVLLKWSKDSELASDAAAALNSLR